MNGILGSVKVFCQRRNFSTSKTQGITALAKFDENKVSRFLCHFSPVRRRVCRALGVYILERNMISQKLVLRVLVPYLHQTTSPNSRHLFASIYAGMTLPGAGGSFLANSVCFSPCNKVRDRDIHIAPCPQVPSISLAKASLVSSDRIVPSPPELHLGLCLCQVKTRHSTP